MATHYTTVEKLKNQLSMILKPTDPILTNTIGLEAQINGAEAYIDSETFRDFRKHEHVVEFHDGNGKDSLITYYYPILSLDHVVMYNQLLQSMRIFLDTELIVQPEWGELWLPPIYPAFMADKPFSAILGNMFIKGRRNIEIMYSWGYETPPEDIQYAALLWAARNSLMLYGGRVTGGAQSQSIDGYSESYGIRPFAGILDAWEKEVSTIIAKWKRITPKSI